MDASDACIERGHHVGPRLRRRGKCVLQRKPRRSLEQRQRRRRSSAHRRQVRAERRAPAASHGSGGHARSRACAPSCRRPRRTVPRRSWRRFPATTPASTPARRPASRHSISSASRPFEKTLRSILKLEPCRFPSRKHERSARACESVAASLGRTLRRRAAPSIGPHDADRRQDRAFQEIGARLPRRPRPMSRFTEGDVALRSNRPGAARSSADAIPRRGQRNVGRDRRQHDVGLCDQCPPAAGIPAASPAARATSALASTRAGPAEHRMRARAHRVRAAASANRRGDFAKSQESRRPSIHAPVASNGARSYQARAPNPSNSRSSRREIDAARRMSNRRQRSISSFRRFRPRRRETVAKRFDADGAKTRGFATDARAIFGMQRVQRSPLPASRSPQA